ncbi:MAG: membrane protein insertion efficiency factor YidD [Planctomycetota bacterium]|nr:MAG: membrane protein insertion efficiency factor YidD [Planctomycetota bacterium]
MSTGKSAVCERRNGNTATERDPHTADHDARHTTCATGSAGTAPVAAIGRTLRNWFTEALVLAVRGYQCSLGLILGGHCRFHPSCSNYFILAVRKYGPLKGTIKGIWRILRCHPFHLGGIDEP